MESTQRLSITRKVSLISAATNALLAALKIVIGTIAHSNALIADGVHSFSDLFSDALVYFATKMGGKHPDAEHPYGHHRLETIAAIIIAVLLILVGAGIVYDSLQHFIDHSPNVVIGTPVLIVALLSIILNEWLYRYMLRAGKRIHSNLLITNAWHNRSDSLISIIVLLSAIGALLGLHYLDAIGAAIIAIIILKSGIKMIWQSFNELMDSAVDTETLQKIRDTITQVSGVQDIHQLRTRLHGGRIFVDVHILVNPKISVSEGHYISDQVYKALNQRIDYISDITVHIDPEDDEAIMPSLNSPDRNTLETALNTAWATLPCHQDITRLLIHYLDGKIQVEVFIPKQALGNQTAEALIMAYRDAAKAVPAIDQVDIHITL